MEELADIVRKLKPTVLIGAAAIPNVFTPEIIKDMASFNESPVIFALSNPTSKAECTAEQASFQFRVSGQNGFAQCSSQSTNVCAICKRIDLQEAGVHKSVSQRTLC